MFSIIRSSKLKKLTERNKILNEQLFEAFKQNHHLWTALEKEGYSWSDIMEVQNPTKDNVIQFRSEL